MNWDIVLIVLAVIGGGSLRAFLGYLQRPKSESFVLKKALYSVIRGAFSGCAGLLLAQQSGEALPATFEAAIVFAFGLAGEYTLKDLIKLDVAHVIAFLKQLQKRS